MSTSELIQIASNAVNAKMYGASRETKLVVSQLLSYEVEGAERNAQFKAGYWDGRCSFFDFKTGTFPAGFASQISLDLRRLGHRVQVAAKKAPLPLGPEIGTVDPLGYGFVERYDYQLETIRQLVKRNRMIARVATGGGKSNIAVLATATIKRPTLFLTTRSVLMHQMARAYEKAGTIPGVLGDGTWRPRHGVNVGMVQSIQARLKEDHPKREATLKLLSYFELVIGEEAHEVGGGGYYDIMSHCDNAMYRLALTATPFMRDGAESNMRLQAAFGGIGMEVSEQLLIERGILATPRFKILNPGMPQYVRRTTSWPNCYDLGVVENKERNKGFVIEAIKGAAHGETGICLVQREKHGNILKKMMSDAGIECAFIFGKNEQSERQEAIRDLKSHQIKVLIASTIFDVGVDLPDLDNLYNAGAGKAEVGTRQRIGRVLREKKGRKNVANIVDSSDMGNKILESHAGTRLSIIQSTPGFAENILPDGVEFPR